MNEDFGQPSDERGRHELTLADLMGRRNQRGIVGPVLFMFFVLLFVFGLIAAIASADEKDVPSSARREIAMRGEQIERIDGQVSSSGEDLIGQAAETPPDDSHKWHLTVLVVANNRACDQLLADLADKREFRDWVNLENHQQSWAHFKPVRYDGAVGKDWARGLEKRLGRALRVPAIVVQPPVNGEFGQHTQAVFVQEGYDGDAAKLTEAMAATIGKYVQKLKETRMIARGGHGQESENEDRGARPPPFLVSPENPPATPGLTLPQTLIPPRVAATAAQIRAAIPEADAEFVLAQIERGSTLEDVLALWTQIKKLRDELQPKPTPAKQPANEVKPQTPPSGFSLTTLIAAVLTALVGSGGIFGLVALALTLFRRWRQASGKPTFLSEEQFTRLLAELKKLQGQQPAQPAQP